MKINKPVKSVPLGGRQAGKFNAIRAAADKLSGGEFLPVEMADKNEAASAYNSLKLQGYSVTVRGTVIYVSRKKTGGKK